MTQWERATGTSKGTPQVMAEPPLRELGINSYRRLSCSPPTWKRCREFAEAAVELMVTDRVDPDPLNGEFSARREYDE